jgi:hypothetical protein
MNQTTSCGDLDLLAVRPNGRNQLSAEQRNVVIAHDVECPIGLRFSTSIGFPSRFAVRCASSIAAFFVIKACSPRLVAVASQSGFLARRSYHNTTIAPSNIVSHNDICLFVVCLLFVCLLFVCCLFDSAEVVDQFQRLPGSGALLYFCRWATSAPKIHCPREGNTPSQIL